MFLTCVLVNMIPLYELDDYQDLGLHRQKPAWDPDRDGPLADSALARLKQLADPQYLPLLYKRFHFMEVMTNEKWATLRDTWDIKDWAPLLIELGCDELAFKSLVLLAQQGPPGRAEANRLIWNFLKPGKLGGKYKDPAQVWQASIKSPESQLTDPLLIIRIGRPGPHTKNWRESGN